MDEEKIRTIKEWKEPINVKGIQSFLGFANFYRRFIKDYRKITAPLTSLTTSAKNLILTGATGASEAYGSTGSKI